MTGLAGSIAFVLSFFTTMPLPKFLTRLIPEKISLSDNIVYFPLVGLFIGALIASVWFVACLFFPTPVAAGIALTSGMLLTGALHEDGLGDTTDGLGATSDREKALEIMRDSRIGTYGVIALLLSVGLRWTALTGFEFVYGALALITAHMISRTTIPIALRFADYARANGLGELAEGEISTSDLAVMIAVALLLALALSGGIGLFAALVTLGIATLLCFMIKARIGGYTGDTLGAMQQVSEITMLILLAGLWS